MSDSRCETCKHWEYPLTGWYDMLARPDREAAENDDEKAARKQHNLEAGRCRAVIAGWEWDGEGPMPLATCWDGSEYRADLLTHKTFGCVLWEAG